MPLQSGQTLNNRYRIVRLLGQGGFGAVYRAWDTNLRRPCAVKENLDTSPEAQRQFAREATVLANLSHPNLVRVTDHFTIEDQGQYLVMDFVEGEDLATTLQNRGTPIDYEQALSWITQVADALAYLHSRQPPVVHRDIKPANIRITPDGRAMLVDFGLVKFFDPHLKTTIGARAVTPGYAPPEQYGQGRTDSRSDIYALGATLYNLVTGSQPLESVRRMVGGKMKPAHEANPEVPPMIGQVIERAMALEPNSRYQEASEFKKALSAPIKPVQSESSPGTYEATMIVKPPAEIHARPAVQAPAARPGYAAPERERRERRPRGLAMGLGVVAIIVICIATVFGVGLWYMNDQWTSATETADAERQSTLDARVQMTSTAEAQASETANAIAAATAQAQATAEALAAGTATAEAGIFATQQAQDNFLNELLANRVQIVGPESGSLEHNTSDDLVSTLDAEVDVQDFVLEVTFYNPYGATEGEWDYGMTFRETGGNDQFRLVINSDQSWILFNTTGDPDGEIIHEGTIAELDVEAGGWNFVRLIAKGETGYFYVNDILIAKLDLSARLFAGDIAIGTGFYVGHEVDGRATEYQQFTVWSLP